MRAPSYRLLATLLVAACAGVARAQTAIDTLVEAYPDQLAGHENGQLIWKDGTRMAISDGRSGKTFRELLDAPDILDQFAIPYRLGPQQAKPGIDDDPGRIRNEAFFAKMYGDCHDEAFKARLVSIPWLPERGGAALLVTPVNGVAEKLAAVSRELAKLPARFTRYMVPSSGTYNCRVIAGTQRTSMHSYAAAIDLNSQLGDYWLWTRAKEGKFEWRNRLPFEIVEIFERSGFIWGGKWFHYDTMHFEYRPEIIAFARKGWPAVAKTPP
jgi:hypothetical protein